MSQMVEKIIRPRVLSTLNFNRTLYVIDVNSYDNFNVNEPKFIHMDHTNVDLKMQSQGIDRHR